MSSAAFAPRQNNGMHARATTTIEVHVIPGGLLAQQESPRHAKASLLDSLRGLSFGLSPRERALAVASGIALALLTLTVIIV